MIIELSGHDRYYDVCQEAKQFFLLESFTEGKIGADDAQYIFSQADGERVLARVRVGGEEACAELTEGDLPFKIKMTVYRALLQATGKRLPWGSLCGVRPAKRALLLLQSGADEAAVLSEYRRFDVSPEKAKLSLAVAQQEMKILNARLQNGISLYISIPFCPSRCTYCSFYSCKRPDSGPLVADYLAALSEEMAVCAEQMKKTGRTVQTIYIGGGTPSVLTAQELSCLLRNLQSTFDLSNLLELTVECGRPDTVTPEKLSVIREGGATRISLNPQTLNDATLQTIGRAHTAEQFLQSYALAQESGISQINCDLIAGLPGETADTFFHSLDTVASLSPANITVHTLSVKRSSVLFDEAQQQEFSRGDLVRAMVDGACERLCASGYFPYYLYRQKNMLGNLENVGYARADSACLYNVFMMEEQQDIIGLGAGSSSVISGGRGKILRSFNVKQPQDYVRRLPEMLSRKRQVFSWLSPLQ